MKKLVLVLCSAIATSAMADDGDLSVYVGTGGGSYEFSEPEFTTDSEFTGHTVVLGSTWDINELDRIDFSWRMLGETEVGGGINAGPNAVGLTVEGFQAALEWQHKLRLSRYIKPWIGVGLIANQLDITDKFRTDEDGFTIETYENRDEITLSLSGTISLDYDVAETFRVTPHVGYEVPLGDGPQGPVIGIKLKYVLAGG